MRSALLLLGTLPLGLAALGGSGDTKTANPVAASPELARSAAVSSNDFFYTGGVIGSRPDGGGLPEGVEAQIRQAPPHSRDSASRFTPKGCVGAGRHGGGAARG